jgi:hypothetical protein
MKGEAQQPLLAAGDDLRVDVEKHGRRRRGRAWLEDFDDPALLDDEEPVRPVSRVTDEERARKTADDGRELNRRLQRMRKE